MGLHIGSSPNRSRSHDCTHQMFLMCNYILLGAASSCIFLTLSLRLFPSLLGFFFILLHAFTIAIAATTATTDEWKRWHGIHMAMTVLTAIFQGSAAVLVFTRTAEFLGALKTYVKEEDGGVILRIAGALGVLIFCLEWVSLALAFALRYYESVEGRGDLSGNSAHRSSKVPDEDVTRDWP